MREADDARRQALLASIELADLDFCSDLACGDLGAGKSDRLFQDRRAGDAGDHANLGAADMDTIAMADCFIPSIFQSEKLALRVFFPPRERFAADEVLTLGL